MDTKTASSPHIAPLLTRKQVAAILGIGLRSLDFHVTNREIPVVKIGKSVRVRQQAVENFIAAREGN